MIDSTGRDLEPRTVSREPAVEQDSAEVRSEPVQDGTGAALFGFVSQPRHAAAMVLVSIAMLRIAAVDLGGIVSNDSLFYLTRADDPFGRGFVVQGYRQAAYPLFITVSNLVGDVFGWDHIFGVALLQRLILVLAVAVTIWALRWWSIPIVAIATSETFVLHTDMLLTEGFLVPSCLLAGALAAGVALGRVATPRLGYCVLTALGVVAMACGAIKLQYGLLIGLVVATAVLLIRDGLVSRAYAGRLIVAIVALLGALGVAQALENRSELGVLEPVSERARAEWYGAWTAVFKVHPENASNPELAEFYDDGNLYTFLHGIEADITDYPTRAEIIRARVEAMFDVAGTSGRREQLNAFVGALGAGRLDDLRSIVTPVLARRGDAEYRLFVNRVGRAEGVAAVVGGYNDGAWPGMASFGPLLDPTQIVLGDHSDVKKPVAWISIAVMLASLLVAGRHRVIVAAALLVVAGAAALMASGYIDNARYLLGPFAIGVIGGTIGVRALVQSPRMRAALGRIR